MTIDNAQAEIRAVLDTVEAEFAKGTPPGTLIPFWYEDDVIVLAEGDPAATRGVAWVLNKAEQMQQELGLRPVVHFTMDDSVLVSGNMAAVLIDARVSPDILDSVEMRFRLLTVWRCGSRGWRIVREMFGLGAL